MAGVIDDLEQRLQRVVGRLGASGLPAVYGWSNDEEARFSEVRFDATSADEACDAFVDRAKTLGAKFVLINVARLEDGELEDALALTEDAEEGTARDRVSRTLRDCRNRIGHVASLHLHFFTDGPPLMFTLSQYAEWNDAVYATEDELGQGDDYGDDDAEEMGDEEIERHAKELAADVRFQKARNNSGWLFAAKKVFGSRMDDLSGEDLRSIIDSAKNIFELEIKPQQEEALQATAREMVAQGRTRSETAAKLGITVQRLARMLA